MELKNNLNNDYQDHMDFICECSSEFDTPRCVYTERETFEFCPDCNNDDFKSIDGVCIGCGDLITSDQFSVELTNGLLCSSCVDDCQLAPTEAKEEE